mgnify:FL=1
MSIRNVRKVNFKAAFFLVTVFGIVSMSLPAKTRADLLKTEDSENSAQRYILDNGLTVLIDPIPTAKTAALYIFVKTGSVNEGEYLGTGISHFLEHMLFKGTAKRSVGQIAQEVKSLGGMINASTSFDYTMYFIELPQEHFAKALDILADMLMNSKIDPLEVEREREVIFGEIRKYRDNPDRKLSEIVLNTAYVKHPYRHPIIGYDELFKRIKREDIWNYYQKYYIPNNVILSVAGDLNVAATLQHIQEVFKDFAPQPYPLRNIPSEADQLGIRYREVSYPTEIPRVSMSYHTVGLLDTDLFALDVLAMILGEGANSRLYKELYENGHLVHGIGASHFTPADPGLLEVEMRLEEANIEKAVAGVKEQIQLLIAKGIAPKELEIIKKRALREYVFSREGIGRAYHNAYYEAFTGEYQFSKIYLDGIRRLRQEDIPRVAKKYLTDSNLTVVILRPLKDEAQVLERVEKPKEPEIKKIVFENGFTILLREDHTFPTVFMNLALQGGTRQETEKNNGIFMLMSGLWAAETKTRSIYQLEEDLQLLGGSLTRFSGRNSFGLTFNILSADLKSGLNILDDVIKNPAFTLDRFKKSKESTKPGILQRKDDIFEVTFQTLRENLFLTHPFRLDELGTIDSIEAIQHHDVIDLYKGFVVPNNMVLSIFGDFQSAEILEILKNKFSTLRPKDLKFVQPREDFPGGRVEKTAYIKKEQAAVMIGFRAPAIREADRYGMDVVNALLGAPLSGRMFDKIRDELGKAYSLGSQYIPGLDTGLTYFYVNTTDDNTDKVKDILMKQIEALQAQDVPDVELANAKAYLKGSYDRGHENNYALSYACVLDELYGLGFNHYKSYSQEIDKITPADIKRIAATYLDPAKAVIILTRPQKTAIGQVEP